MRIVIFCGGYGTRMWPVSRKSFPKQFYPLIAGKSFFELTYKRFRKAFSPEDIFTSAEAAYTPLIRKIAPDIPKENIIEEPERRDNLGAIGLVCTVLENRFPNDVVMLSWSDHIINDEEKFLKAVLAAGEYAKETDFIVSIDEEPSYPTIHNGWVKIGESLEEFKGFNIQRITKHIEKPKIEVAKKMFINGGYLINTGYRAFRTDIMLSYFLKYQPDIYKGLTKIKESLGKKYAPSIIYREYHKFPKDSIESGVFEKLPEDKRVAIAVKVGWKDSGTWDLFFRSLKAPKDDNLVEGNPYVEFIEAKDNLVIGGEGKAIGVIGLENLVIIDTPDGLLVANKDKTDKVKDLFKILEAKKPKFVE